MTSSNGYVLIPVSALKLEEVSPFDIFVRVSHRFIKVLNKGELPDIKRIRNYLEKKDDVLYIEASTIEYFMDEKFSELFDLASGQKVSGDRISSFVRCLELCYLDIRLVRINPDKFMRFALLSDLAFDFFNDHFVRGQVLKNLYYTAQPVSKRALFGGSLAMSLFFVNDSCSVRAFRSLFVGAMLRDIGSVFHNNKDPHSLTDAERETEKIVDFEKHPSRTVEKLKEFNVLDDVVETIIMQHHEKPLGNGFPAGLKRVETYKPAQYLCVADWIVTLIEQRTHSTKSISESELLVEINKLLPEEQRNLLPLINRVLSATFQISRDQINIAS